MRQHGELPEDRPEEFSGHKWLSSFLKLSLVDKQAKILGHADAKNNHRVSILIDFDEPCCSY